MYTFQPSCFKSGVITVKRRKASHLFPTSINKHEHDDQISQKYSLIRSFCRHIKTCEMILMSYVVCLSKKRLRRYFQNYCLIWASIRKWIYYKCVKASLHVMINSFKKIMIFNSMSFILTRKFYNIGNKCQYITNGRMLAASKVNIIRVQILFQKLVMC